MKMARMSMSLCLAFMVASGSIFEVSGTFFLLRHYLKKMPKFSKDVEPFAYRGITTYMLGLQRGCPETLEFKTFFSKLHDYMNTVNSVYQMSGSMDSKAIQSQMKEKSEGLYTAISQLSGGQSGSAEAKKIFETMQSLAKTLMEQRRSSSLMLSADQQRSIQSSISKYAQLIGQFVSLAAQKNGGHSIDFSSALNIGNNGEITSPSVIGRRGSAGSSFSMGSGTSSFGASSGSASGGSFRSGSYGSSYDSSAAAAMSRGYGASGSTGGSSSTCQGPACGNANIKGTLDYESSAKSSHDKSSATTSSEMTNSGRLQFHSK